MKIDPKLIELMQELKPLTTYERLEILLEIARAIDMGELEKAIIHYWFDEGYNE